ncbi:hypothetical protein Fmac_014806 [Flemingia macrophylla]|uniref:Peroxidase n=1 Tax=Flemingia macrophylla TaxID=520843 RepID=A0ABD1MCS4_9FABA
MAINPGTAASLLRLHFHDCFANGCDGSVLLDDTGNFTGEKTALPNINSLRGFEIIDLIKYKLEWECPLTVSCADILALVAREAVNLSIGPYWRSPALLGRRDGTTANFNEASELPSPFDTLQNITNKFISKGLDIQDLVVLSGLIPSLLSFDNFEVLNFSGAHTIGVARCLTFKQRLFNYNSTGKPDPSLNPLLLKTLQKLCHDNSSDSLFAPLDAVTVTYFDNMYYKNIVKNLGLLQTDQALMSNSTTASLVVKYSQWPSGELAFYEDFDASLEKMGLIGVLTGQSGKIRENCRMVN